MIKQKKAIKGETGFSIVSIKKFPLISFCFLVIFIFPIYDQIYCMTISYSGKCLSSTSSLGDTSSSKLILTNCTFSKDQFWELTAGGEIKNNNDKCLDIRGGKIPPDNGNEVQIYDCHGGNNQQWVLSPSGEIKMYQSYGSEKCLQVSLNNPENIQVFDCNGSTNQKWKIKNPISFVMAKQGIFGPRVLQFNYLQNYHKNCVPGYRISFTGFEKYLVPGDLNDDLIEFDNETATLCKDSNGYTWPCIWDWTGNVNISNVSKKDIIYDESIIDSLFQNAGSRYSINNYYIGVGSGQYNISQSPWFQNPKPLNISFMDYLPKDGWRLLKKRFIDEKYPYFSVYNKFSGILRTCFFIEDLSELFTYGNISLTVLNANGKERWLNHALNPML